MPSERDKAKRRQFSIRALLVGTLVAGLLAPGSEPEPLPIARIDEKDGEKFAFFEGKGHAPMSELTNTPSGSTEDRGNHATKPAQGRHASVAAAPRSTAED